LNRQLKRGVPCKYKNLAMLIAHAPRDCHINSQQ
jgi:hypothetical protein